MGLLIEGEAFGLIRRDGGFFQQVVVVVPVPVGLVPLGVLGIGDGQSRCGRTHRPGGIDEGILEPDVVPIAVRWGHDYVDVDARVCGHLGIGLGHFDHAGNALAGIEIDLQPVAVAGLSQQLLCLLQVARGRRIGVGGRRPQGHGIVVADLAEAEQDRVDHRLPVDQ